MRYFPPAILCLINAMSAVTVMCRRQQYNCMTWLSASVYHDHRLRLEGHAETGCRSGFLVVLCVFAFVCGFGWVVLLVLMQLWDVSMRHRWGVVLWLCIGGECRLRSAWPEYSYMPE